MTWQPPQLRPDHKNPSIGRLDGITLYTSSNQANALGVVIVKFTSRT
jgi:hypothetical protein